MLGYVFLMISFLCMFVCLKSFSCLTISSICDLTTISSSPCSSSLERAYHSMYLSVCWLSSNAFNPVDNLCLFTLLIDNDLTHPDFHLLLEIVASTMSTAGAKKYSIVTKSPRQYLFCHFLAILTLPLVSLLFGIPYPETIVDCHTLGSVP